MIVVLFLGACAQNKQSETDTANPVDWKRELNQQLSLFGHRNWILIVDKAFPAQTADGIITLDTKEAFFPVLEYTLDQIGTQSHVKPILYSDKELSFVTEEQAPGITAFRDSLVKVTGADDLQVMLHDSVFAEMDEASRLFKVLVLKTEMTIPYSSVFIQLDCRYWSADKERVLRKTMMVN